MNLTATAAWPPPERQLKFLRQRLMRHARGVTADVAVAEDLVQETLVAVVEQAGRHGREASLVTWATAVLKHKIADWYRSPLRWRTVSLSEGEDAGIDGDTSPAGRDGTRTHAVPPWQQPDQLSEQRQLMATVAKSLARLPEQAGSVFLMRDWLGYETPEVCACLHITAENCRTILHRTRMALRARLHVDGTDTCAATIVAASKGSSLKRRHVAPAVND